ncbi:MAG: hypothetical protein KBC21_04465 [Candidatus Pacebacteria bacterium]|nr:hypothetical protein [Candidatus Paceibacterota bacterium]
MSHYSQLHIALQKARADITNRKVACIIEDTDGNQYEGFNIEYETSSIAHAEINALQKIGDRKIKTISLMSSLDAVKGIKAVIPCESCVQHLCHNSTEDTEVRLYCNKSDTSYGAQFVDMVEAYKSKPQALIISSFDEIKTHTRLSTVDIKVLETFREEINKLYKVELFITGSAAGFSPTCLFVQQVLGKPYGDVDLIFIFPNGYPKNLDDSIISAYQNALKRNAVFVDHINVLEKESYVFEEMGRDNEGFLCRKEYVPSPDGDSSSLDISIGTSLESVITKVYLEKNWIIRID